MRRSPLLKILVPLLLAIPAAVHADKPEPLGAQGITASFVEAQDDPVYTPEQMDARAVTLGADREAVAADVALNQWKQCVLDALVHWTPLTQGAGVLIDGAYGRCAEAKRDYRDHLVRMTPGGRAVIDVSLARNLAKALEEGWRPRLTAVILDQMLARQQATVPPPAREPAARNREEHGPKP